MEAAVNSIPEQPPQRLSLRNFDVNTWEVADERTASYVDAAIHVTIDTDPDRLIEPGTRSMRMRAEWFDPGDVLFAGWSARIDQAIWTVVP